MTPGTYLVNTSVEFKGSDPFKNYGVSFPMAAKISVKGADQAAIYKWLTQKALNGVQDAEVKWNFHKFLMDENGKLIAVFPSSVKPEGPEIKAALAK